MIQAFQRKWNLEILKIRNVFHAMDAIGPIVIDVYSKKRNNWYIIKIYNIVYNLDLRIKN